jgi:pilus assembly protein Flp/PilA
MKNTKIEFIRSFIRDERGTTAIEYALIASIISIAIATVAVTLGETVRDDLFGKVATALGV